MAIAGGSAVATVQSDVDASDELDGVIVEGYQAARPLRTQVQ